MNKPNDVQQLTEAYQTIVEKRHKCIRCNTSMGKHPDAEKAKKGYKNCPKCNMTHSPEATVKGSYAMYNKDTGKIETGVKKESLESEAINGQPNDQQAVELKIDELSNLIRGILERSQDVQSHGKDLLHSKLRTIMFRVREMKEQMR